MAYRTPQGWKRHVQAVRDAALRRGDYPKKNVAERRLIDTVLQGFSNRAEAEDYLEAFEEQGHNAPLFYLPNGSPVTKAQLDHAIKQKWT